MPSPSVLVQNATFWSRETGSISVYDIGGDNPRPWETPPKVLYVTLSRVDSTLAATLKNLVHDKTILATAIIDDKNDGLYYQLNNVVATRFTGNRATPRRTPNMLTLSVGEIHLSCGPPTCARLVRY